MKYKWEKEEKFDRIYQAYADEVYKVCFYLVKDKEVALEIMQQTFVKFYGFFENVAPEYIFPYLVNIAKNLVYGCNNNS